MGFNLGIVDVTKIQDIAPLNQIKVLAYRDKDDWILETKYNIGSKKKKLTSNLSVAIKDRLYYTLGKRPETASSHDIYMALCYAIRDRMIDYHLAPEVCTIEKQVAYLSAEFLIGPQVRK